ncbi:BTB/POZ domain protein [Aspergillus violaceofuscus CBS 115571]|uniref:BTB/POZ domain protein n=1 Tax=Aspergillus violaceofuscus (strain CBS 115571) TaxID=1450538 RepID=A0A2V5H0B2_ASPV1|nr:BTB/POZ domain protein [Aspergillus violaceofuscus CBS 115571]
MASSNQAQKSVRFKDTVNAEKPGDLLASIKKYYASSKFSDLTIHTLDQDLKVHRLVVCGQSEYFSRLYEGEWLESGMNEIDLKVDDPRAIEAMFHFMYGYRYDSSDSDQGRASPMLFAVKVYQVADKYQVPQLKDRAREKFKSIVETCWQTDDFPVAIEEAYKRTIKEDRSLRDIL